MIDLYGSEDVGLDHLTVYGGFPALLVNAAKNIRVTHCAFRGLADCVAVRWMSKRVLTYRVREE